MTRRTPGELITARQRLIVSAAAGLLTGLLLIVLGQPSYALLGGWDVAALSYVAGVLLGVLPFDAPATRIHALQENPGRATADALLIAASLASLVAIGILVLLARDATGAAKAADIGLSLISVVISWSVVHTLFLLRYARIYYGDPEGGVDFNQEESPQYTDFAYLSFTVGMAYQVSDTDITSRPMRSAILAHALLAYVFGTVIIATMINAIAGLS